MCCSWPNGLTGRKDMIILKYSYDRLRGRIVEKYGSQEKYAEVLGISRKRIIVNIFLNKS